MVIGNIGAGIFLFLPLVFVGAGPFIVLRALAGLADLDLRSRPRAATSATRRRPIGAARRSGCTARPRWAGSSSGRRSAGSGRPLFGGFGVHLHLRRDRARSPPRRRSRSGSASGRWRRGAPREASPRGRSTSPRSRTSPITSSAGRTRVVDARRRTPAAGRARLASRTAILVAAILFNIGGNFAAGTYEVIWSLFLTGLGGGIELVGLTFAMFGLPVLVLSPAFGRRVDRGGMTIYLVAGTVLPVAAALVYTVIRDPLLAIPLILVEATGFAMFNPALFSIVAAGSPAGRSSTAQGVFGAAGTLGLRHRVVAGRRRSRRSTSACRSTSSRSSCPGSRSPRSRSAGGGSGAAGGAGRGSGGLTATRPDRDRRRVGARRHG